MNNPFHHFFYPFGRAKVDSFRIFIPLKSVISYPGDLDSTNVINSVRSTTGEIISTRSARFYLPIGSSSYSSDVPFEVTRKRLFDNEYYFEFVLTSYTASSSFSESSYFSGITMQGVHRFFDGLSQYGFLFHQDFLTKSFISDLDVCLDFRFSDSSLDIDLLSDALRSSVLDRSSNCFVITHQKINGAKICTGGYQYARRGFPFSKVFFKVYDKYAYSLKKGRLSPLMLESIKGVYRFEFTVKNSRHLEHLLACGRSLRSFNLFDLIGNSELCDSLFSSVFTYQFPCFFDNISIPDVSLDGLAGKDLLISFLCSQITFGEVDKSSKLFADFLESSLFSRVQKSRYKKLLQDILFS